MASAKIWQGVFNRPAIYSEAAALTEDLYIFTGELDVQTRPQEALLMKTTCELLKKQNCEVQLVPGLGHAMSQPKGPRRHRLLDISLGPVDESFKVLLDSLASKL